MRLILVHLLWHFDIELDRRRMENMDWMAVQGIWILWDKKPLWVVLKNRST
jgi:averantin hydroxylase